MCFTSLIAFRIHYHNWLFSTAAAAVHRRLHTSTAKSNSSTKYERNKVCQVTAWFHYTSKSWLGGRRGRKVKASLIATPRNRMEQVRPSSNSSACIWETARSILGWDIDPRGILYPFQANTGLAIQFRQRPFHIIVLLFDTVYYTQTDSPVTSTSVRINKYTNGFTESGFALTCICSSFSVVLCKCGGLRWADPLPRTPKKLRGLNPQANYTDRATAACRRS
jgi:hypothetical protein